MSKCQTLSSLSKQSFHIFLKSFDNVMLDCDGVLWKGTEAISGSSETVQLFRKLGKNMYFCTNNSTKSRASYVVKLEKMGFGGNMEEVVGTSYLTAAYLKSINFKGKVYVVGSQGIIDELELMGIDHVKDGVGPDPLPKDCNLGWLGETITQEIANINCVVCGFDAHISYKKIMKAASILANPEHIYIATNTDEQFPNADNSILPGTGSIVAAITTASNRQPKIMGKPSPLMFETVKQRNPDIQPERTLMVGDRANTDILLGKNCGLQTMMVGSGCNSWNDIQRWEKSDKPEENLLVANFYVDCLGDFKSLYEKYDQ